jgi:hypothetical protein
VLILPMLLGAFRPPEPAKNLRSAFPLTSRQIDHADPEKKAFRALIDHHPQMLFGTSNLDRGEF